MISWIKGEIIDTWLQNKKFYVLINCNGLGYEIQILDSLKTYLNEKVIALWIQQIKREDVDLYFGFKEKQERDFFRNLLNVKGIGTQIGMSLLNKHDLNKIVDSVISQDKKLFNSVPGIGQKMTERILFELKNKILTSEVKTENHFKESNNICQDEDVKNLMDDIDLALKSLSYSLKERKETNSFLIKSIDDKKISNIKISQIITFENLLKDALDYLQRKQ